jgi:SAM-dependent methyltransferase
MEDIAKILLANELAIDKWVNRPKLSKKMSIVDHAKLLHDTKRYFIVHELSKLHRTLNRPLRVFDFGSGQGGLTIDVKIALGEKIILSGYDVSPKAISTAKAAAELIGVQVDFILDAELDPRKVFHEKFDAIISCDVFGHVPSIPKTFCTLFDLLAPGGKIIAFSETITGDYLTIPKWLARKGFITDDSEEEHISLHSVFELKQFLIDAGFLNSMIYPYDPIRFAFYPKRYLSKLIELRHPLAIAAGIFTLFQNRATEILFNQFNLFLAKHISLRDTAGCLLVASRPL